MFGFYVGLVLRNTELMKIKVPGNALLYTYSSDGIYKRMCISFHIYKARCKKDMIRLTGKAVKSVRI